MVRGRGLLIDPEDELGDLVCANVLINLIDRVMQMEIEEVEVLLHLDHLGDPNPTQMKQLVLVVPRPEIFISDNGISVDVEARVWAGPDSFVLNLNRGQVLSIFSFCGKLIIIDLVPFGVLLCSDKLIE